MKMSKIALAMGLGMVLVSGFANAAASGTTTAAGAAGHGTVHFKGDDSGTQPQEVQSVPSDRAKAQTA